MKCWQKLGAGCFLLIAVLPTMGKAQNLAIKDGDTVVFYGDSITAQHLYTRFVEEFVLTRYPAMHVRFVNAGVPGDTSYGGYAGAMLERVQRDVAPFHPAMITVMLGMNDGGYVSPSPMMDATFRKGYIALLDALTLADPNAGLTLVLPTPYDEITHGTDFPGYSKTIDSLAKDVVEMAEQRRARREPPALVVDFDRPIMDALERANREFPQLAPLLVPDRIHPGAPAHWIMAAVLLSAWHVDPVVSRVTISAASVRAVETERAAITALQKTETGLQWTELDEALPLPLDLDNAMTAVLLGVSDVGSVDQQPMQVTGLAKGNYQLFVDKKLIGAFSSEALGRGVNLALLKTPMLDQARGIDWEEDRRATLDQARFILSAETAKMPDPGPAEERLQAAEDELAATIRKQTVPKTHVFELRRQ